MALICPINGNLCSSDCAWRVGEKCVTVDMAMSFRREEIRRYAFETLSNMRYGTTIMKDGKSYSDTDGIGPYDGDKLHREGYKNENT